MVKAIRVVDGHAEVVPELCILCGHCVSVCPVGAKKVREDVAKVKHVLSTKRAVYVSLAPSFVSEFSEEEQVGLFEGLDRLGFAGVSETALGAEAVSSILAKRLSDAIHASTNDSAKKASNQQTLYLSSACPSAVEYIKKYHPSLSSYLIELSSPLMAHARLLKQLYGMDIGVVFIGPCIAKKREADIRPELIDAALTFLEVRNWLAAEGLSLELGGRRMNFSSPFSPPFVPRKSKDGSLYPVDGGMVRTIFHRSEASPDLCTSLSGIREISKALGGLEMSQFEAPLFVEILACPGGCVNGPACTKKNGTLMKRNQILSYHKKTTIRDEDPKGIDLFYRWGIEPLPKGKVTDREIRDALSKVGKYSVEDELNCGGCGYDTCRQFAEAFVMKKAEPTMCLSYMRKLAQKKADALLKAMPTGVVVVDEGLSIVECNRNFARLFGKEVEELYETKPGLEKASLKKLVPFADLFETVLETGVDILEKDLRYGEKILKGSIFTVERGRYVGGIFQDITLPFIQKDRIVEQAEKIIRKQLSTVQKIAYLLGENAAESEVMLNAIIQSFGQEGR